MTQSANDNQIEVRNLWKVFGNNPELAFQDEFATASRAEIQEALGLVVALRDVSFKVDKGQIFVVMGLSGSGKSTLVRCLIRLIEATRGEVHFDGEDILQYSSEQLIDFRRQKIAMVFQHYGLLPHRRVLDNVAYGLEIRGADKETRHEAAAVAIETVGLKGWENYLPSEMSGGMQQRVGLARALAGELGCDADGRAFQRAGSAHTAGDAGRADFAANGDSEDYRIHNARPERGVEDRRPHRHNAGREIVQEGSPEEIVTLPADDYVTSFVQDVSRAKVIQAKAIMQDRMWWCMSGRVRARRFMRCGRTTPMWCSSWDMTTY